jgi:hypothetical protein
MVLLGIAASRCFSEGALVFCWFGNPYLPARLASPAFISLLFPRPILFYLARYFMAGTDPQRQAHYNRRGERFCGPVDSSDHFDLQHVPAMVLVIYRFCSAR